MSVAPTGDNYTKYVAPLQLQDVAQGAGVSVQQLGKAEPSEDGYEY